MAPTRTILSVLFAGLVTQGQLAFAQPAPDPGAQLKLQLAASAAAFVAGEVGEVSEDNFAGLVVTVVCMVEALGPLPDSVKERMVSLEDFEDGLDLAVVFAETMGGDLGASLEANLRACF